MHFDVFNGDADGLCALQQLRLAQPRPSTLVTGIKRDIALLKRVEAGEGDTVTVLDVSFDKNREPLEKILARGAAVQYFDHHYAGESLLKHDKLQTHIDLSADTCTSLIVNHYLNSQFAAWAVVGSFGDNFDQSALNAAADLSLTEAQLADLRTLGISLNYNGYGATVADLFFDPADLAQRMLPFADPLTFIAEDSEVFTTLRDGAAADVAKAEQVQPETVNEHVALYVFPAEAWARRVSGVFSNQLATANPDRAHALLTALPAGGYVVSVRAPLNNKTGADELCRSFPTGGGRKAAAGINNLPDAMFDDFAQAFQSMYGG